MENVIITFQNKDDEEKFIKINCQFDPDKKILNYKTMLGHGYSADSKIDLTAMLVEMFLDTLDPDYKERNKKDTEKKDE